MFFGLNCCRPLSLQKSVAFLGLLSLAFWAMISFEEQTQVCPETTSKTYPRDGVGNTIKLGPGFFPETLKSLCHGMNLTAIIPVNSAVESFKRRRALRESLKGVCAKRNCRAFFLVAASVNKTVMEQLKVEISNHRDILMVEKEDNYYNICNKLVAMLQWLSSHCTNAKYVIFMNEDTFVNVDLFLMELAEAGGEHCNCIFGNTVLNAVVKRDNKSRWYIPPQDYKCEFYPEFCFGPAYAFPNILTPKLLSGVFDAPYVWPDDVWLTGLVREYVGIRILRRTRPVWSREDDTFKPYQYKNFLFVHNVTVEQQHRAYDNIDRGTDISAFISELQQLTLLLLCMFLIGQVIICRILSNVNPTFSVPYR